MSVVWRVVIIGGQPTSRLGTKLILEEETYLNVIGMTSVLSEGIPMVKELKPDLILLDYLLPEDRLEGVIGQIKEQLPGSHVVILSNEEGLVRANSLLCFGASGVLSQQASPTQLLLLIEALREGYTCIPIDWLKNGIWPAVVPVDTNSVFKLSETEIFIMECIVRGMTYDRIALEIELSRRTIDNYLRRIYVKLDVNTRAQAIEKFSICSAPMRSVYI